MTSLNKKLYDEKFYEYSQKSIYSSKIITKLIYDIFYPKSVCDIGCGRVFGLLTISL